MDILKTGNILVPYDFSEVADSAIAYENNFAKIFNKNISLLHIVEKQGLFSAGSSTKEKEAMQKLTVTASENKDKSGVETEVIIKPGNIFDEIGETAEAINSTLIVMGTHGIKGMQALTGSKAMKVITNSKTPFVVVRKKPWSSDGIKRIMLPINDEPQTKQKVEWAKFMAQIFKSTVDVISQDTGDQFINNKVKNNVAWTKNTLKHEGVESDDIFIPKSEALHKAAINKAVELGTGLIIVNTDPETNIAEYVMGPFEQKIIANEAQIPVMCINSKKVYSVSGSMMSSI